MGTSYRRYGIVGYLGVSMELKRILLQKELDSGKTTEERRQLGQFSTPYALACDMIRCGLRLRDNTTSPITFLDPAFGTGVFYSSLCNIHKTDNIAYATGIEIDAHYAVPALQIWKDYNIDIKITDFTKEEPDKKYNFIICNPPYVRHHFINSNEKNRLRGKTFFDSGEMLSGLAGLYCHFILQSFKWMEEDGIAGWLVPSEFMSVNYGIKIKHFLLNTVTLLHIHSFDINTVQFDDALVSSTVLWFKKSRPATFHNITFSYGESLNNPANTQEVSSKVLTDSPKWTHFRQMPKRVSSKDIPKLRDYFSVKRGIATGNNKFFILRKEKILELKLPFEFFRPILPSIRYIPDSEIQSDNEGNPILRHKLFLLDCKLYENEIKNKYSTLWNYLESGRERVASRYLCKSRKCWYFQEQREAPLFICTYMGREPSNEKPTFRFILNHSNAIVTN
jgi:hypothetical protein